MFSKRMVEIFISQGPQPLFNRAGKQVEKNAAHVLSQIWTHSQQSLIYRVHPEALYSEVQGRQTILLNHA